MEQIAITIPYAFIVRKVRLTWREAKFGIDEGLLSPREALCFACDELNRGDDSDEVLVLASARQDEPVAEMVGGLAQIEEPQELEEIRRLWAFLVLAWILEHRDRFEDALDLAEKVYADLEYPEQVAPLIRYMPSDEPALADPEANMSRLFENWERYVADEGEHFGSRNLEAGCGESGLDA